MTPEEDIMSDLERAEMYAKNAVAFFNQAQNKIAHYKKQLRVSSESSLQSSSQYEEKKQ